MEGGFGGHSSSLQALHCPASEDIPTSSSGLGVEASKSVFLVEYR